MNSFRCPYLDTLGRNYVEAFRRAREGELFYQTDAEKDTAVHQLGELSDLLMRHRTVCPLCRLTKAKSDGEVSQAMSAIGSADQRVIQAL